MKLTMQNNTRMSNFELLRIFAMFLIVLHHCIAHGVFSYWHDNSSVALQIQNFVCFILASGGEIGVTIFVLLTGYFSCQQNFRLKKCLDIYLKTCFFSILIFCALFIIDPKAITTAYSSFFPLNQGGYWFITSWLLMLSFSPFLNMILKNHSSKTIRNYLIYGAILWIVLPSFNLNLGYSPLLYFMYLYLLGGSLRLGHIKFSKKYSVFLITTILGYFFVFIITSFLSIGKHISLWYFWQYIDVNSIYVFTFSLWLFHIFKNIEIKIPWINWVASSMFGVYLLHNHDLIRPYLWHTLLSMDTSMRSPFFTIWALIVSICVFCLCVVLDKFLSLIYMPLIEHIDKKLSQINLLKKYF